MIGQLLKPINSALSFAFNVVIAIFGAIGFPWLAAVCLMVLVSVVLRLFTAQFIGNSISSGIESYNAKKAEQEAETARFIERRREFYKGREMNATHEARIKSGKVPVPKNKTAVNSFIERSRSAKHSSWRNRHSSDSEVYF